MCVRVCVCACVCLCVYIAVSDRIVLVRGHADHSRRCDILRLESATIRPASAPVQKPHGPDDIVGHRGHAHVVHVPCRLCADVQVRVNNERVATRPAIPPPDSQPSSRDSRKRREKQRGRRFVHASFHTQARG